MKAEYYRVLKDSDVTASYSLLRFLDSGLSRWSQLPDSSKVNGLFEYAEAKRRAKEARNERLNPPEG